MTCPVCGLGTAQGPHTALVDCLAALRAEVARLGRLVGLQRQALTGLPDY